MERVCFLLKVKPQRLKEYKERHRAVWPEMLQALRETGWQNYSLFLREDGLLVGYFETPNYKRALEGMAKREVNERWQRDMAQMLLLWRFYTAVLLTALGIYMLISHLGYRVAVELFKIGWVRRRRGDARTHDGGGEPDTR